jgi:hypothetical protein
MKNVFFIFVLILITVSCEKTKTEVNPEIPNWLADKISHDEEIMKTNHQSGLEPAAWIRYNYKGSYYFEYVNLLSSAGPVSYNNDGTEFNVPLNEYLKYQSDRCYRIIIWEGPSFIDLWD